MGKLANDWLVELDKDDTRSLACYQLVHMFSFTETNAAEYVAAMVIKSDRTVTEVLLSTMMAFSPNPSRVDTKKECK